MSNRARGYYYGSYGLIRGYGALYRTLRDADESVFADGRAQRKHGGSTDRNAVLVDAETGLCWWAEEGETKEEYLVPVKTPNGDQAKYPSNLLEGCKALWQGPTEVAGFS